MNDMQGNIIPLIASILAVACFVAQASAQTILTYSDDNFEYRVVTDSVLSGDSINYDCVARSIDIRRRSDRSIVQSIVPDENYGWCTLPQDQILIVEDMNFDGYNDIRLFGWITAGPNTPYYFWVYDPTASTFRRDTSLEEITSPYFDHDKHLIYSFWRASCCHHGSSTYKYIRGKITKIEEYEVAEDLNRPGWYITTRKKLVNGELKLVERDE